MKPTFFLSLVISFAWVCLTNGQWDSNAVPGRTAMVHLFEWKWGDIADECERYLGPNGFAGVQVRYFSIIFFLSIIKVTVIRLGPGISKYGKCRCVAT